MSDQEIKISIHAAQEGCDDGDIIIEYVTGISIHAAQEGCDYARNLVNFIWKDFNPRSPRGLRHEY